MLTDFSSSDFSVWSTDTDYDLLANKYCLKYNVSAYNWHSTEMKTTESTIKQTNENINKINPEN